MSEFDEWYEQEMGSENKPEYEAAKLAWNHQQAKIDELQKLRSLDEMAINQLAQANQVWQIKCNELQGRIDEALNTLCKLQYSSGERIYNDVGNILKGNKDEN